MESALLVIEHAQNGLDTSAQLDDTNKENDFKPAHNAWSIFEHAARYVYVHNNSKVRRCPSPR